MRRHTRHARHACWAYHAVVLSVGLHAAVISGAWWACRVPSVAPPDARFAAGEQPLVVRLQLVERRDADGVRLTYTAAPPMPTPDETRIELPAMPQAVQRAHGEPSTETGAPLALPVVELEPVVFESTPTPAAPPAPPPPPPAQATGVRTEPTPVDMPPLRYPPLSRRLGEAGTVLLEALVKTDGSVADIRVIRSPGYPRLEQAARQALRAARFQPATRHGQPIACTVRVPFTFQLSVKR